MFKATGVMRGDESKKRRTVIFKGNGLSGDSDLINGILIYSSLNDEIAGYQPDGPLHKDGLAVVHILRQLLEDDAIFLGKVPELPDERNVLY